MGIYGVKPAFQRLLRPIEALLVRAKVHPTVINLAALLFSIAGGFALFYAASYPLLLIYIPIMAFVRTALNALDGMVARDLKVKNQGWGEVLNEFIDRVSDAAIFFGLALAPYANLRLGGLVVIIVLLNSYLSIVSKAAGGTRQYGGFMGKADRMIYLAIAAFAMFVTKNFAIANYLMLFIGAGTALTMVQRFLSIRRELRK